MSWLMRQSFRMPLLTPAEEIALGTMIRRWLDHPEPVPPAIKRAGLRARSRFVEANIRLVYSVFQKYTSMTQGFEDDAIQAGMMGLMRAVDKFDPARGYKFSTYAYWWIRQGIQRFTRAEMATIHLPHEHANRRKQLLAAEQRLATELGRMPTNSELAADLGCLERMIDAIRNPPVCSHSIDYKLAEDGGDLLLLDTLSTACSDHTLIDEILDAIDELPEQQQQVLHALYIDVPPASCRALAERMGVDRNRITWIANEAIQSLQRRLGQPVTPLPLARKCRREAMHPVLF